jgi:hypothetical protein
VDVPEVTEVVAVLHVQTLLLIHFLRGELHAHRPAADDRVDDEAGLVLRRRPR